MKCNPAQVYSTGAIVIWAQHVPAATWPFWLLVALAGCALIATVIAERGK